MSTTQNLGILLFESNENVTRDNFNSRLEDIDEAAASRQELETFSNELMSHKAEDVTQEKVHGFRIESGTWTPTFIWTGATPVTKYLMGRYKIIGKYCFFQMYYSTENGNGATNLEISPPVQMKGIGGWPFPVESSAAVGGLSSNPYCYCHDGINTVKFSDFPVFTKGQYCAIRLSGWFEMA